MTREQLKAIVKECLQELLRDGLGSSIGSNQQVTRSVSGVSEHRSRHAAKAFDPRLDTPIAKQVNKPANVMNEVIKREAGGNAMMEAIFADTVATTIPAQIANGDTGGSMRASLTQQEQFNGTPEGVFGDSAARWANLAFMSPSSTKKLM